MRAVRSVLGNKATDKIKKRIVDKRLRELGDLAEQALKTTVPVDTEELRNVFITQDVQPDHIKVGIAHGTHFGADELPRSARGLANLLNKNSVFKRSQNSHNDGPYSMVIPKGSPTAQWIDKALLAFKEKRSGR